MIRNLSSNSQNPNLKFFIKIFAVFYLSLLIFGLIILNNIKWIGDNITFTIIISISIFLVDVVICIYCIRNNWFERINSNTLNWYQSIEFNEIVDILNNNFLVTESLNLENVDPIDTKSCRICMEEYEIIDMNIKYIRLNCNHEFCITCIATWTNSRNTCPICRVEIINNNQVTNV